MDVGSGALAGNHGPQRDVGNAQGLKLLAEPLALGSVGVNAHIDATGVIEAQRGMERALTAGADGERLAKLLFVGGLNVAQVFGLEDTTTGELFNERRGLDVGLTVGEELLFDAGHAEELGEGTGAVFGELEAEAAVSKLLFDLREMGTRKDALLDERELALILAGDAVDAAGGGIDHFAGLLFAERFHTNVAVHEAAQSFFIAGIGELFLSLLEAGAGDSTDGGQFLETFYFLTRLFNSERIGAGQLHGGGEDSAKEKALTHIH